MKKRSFVEMAADSKLMTFLKNSELVLTTLIAFFLPLVPRAEIFLITGVTLLVIWQRARIGFVKPKINTLPFAVFFFVYLIGLLYTSNFDHGWKEIESRIAFVLLPLVYCYSVVDYKKLFRWVIWALVLGCLLSSVICYYYALQCFAAEGARFCFEASHLSHYMHPTYLSLIYIVGLTFLIIESYSNNRIWWYKILTFIVGLYLLYFVYGFYSIGPWISFFVMVGILIFAVFYFKKRLLYFFLVFIGILIGVIIMVSKFELLRSDYDTISKELSAYFENKDEYIAENQNNTQSIKARIILWNTSMDFIAEHPFGVGTGDVKDELIAYYETKGMTAYAEQKLNPHNQYLQTGVSVGWLGILSLVFAFFYHLRLGFKHRNYFLLSLITLVLISCLFESILERQNGILLLMFFLSIVVKFDYRLETKQLIKEEE